MKWLLKSYLGSCSRSEIATGLWSDRGAIYFTMSLMHFLLNTFYRGFTKSCLHIKSKMTVNAIRSSPEAQVKRV